MDDDVAAPFASTAYWIAAVRAKESARPDRLFDDPYAEAMAGKLGAEVMARSERATGGDNPYLPIRTRFIDDVLVTEAKDCRQIVLLGAGFDVRAVRLPLAQGTRVFEIDQKDTFERKEAVLAAAGARPRSVRVTVQADLTGDWPDLLLAKGFNPELSTAWVAEGVFFYLPDRSVGALLRLARRLSAPGSLFVADMFGTGLMSSPGMTTYLTFVARRGLAPPFCTDAPAELFAAHGWEEVAVVEPGQPRANFGRIGADGRQALASGWSPTRAWLVVGHVPNG